MAERYISTSRILMEFVDNSLDDAEALFDHDTGAYSRNVTIDVHVSRQDRTLRIIDDCRGMAPDTLARVVMRVGESRKRGASFVNGQFGFGMQAFRAACSTLTVRSRTAGEEPYQIRIERKQSDGFQLEALGEADHALEGKTGTEVLLQGFDAQWIDNTFQPSAVALEIESHFERLLDRPGLTVRVHDDDLAHCTTAVHEGEDGEVMAEVEEACEVRLCKPVDYSLLGAPGASVKKEIDLGGGQMAQCNLCVMPAGSAAAAAAANNGALSPPVDDIVNGGMDSRGARFFVTGRRIAACGSTPSFAKQSSNRWTVWGHPQVVGYIDILGTRNGPLQPVITRTSSRIQEGVLRRMILSSTRVKALWRVPLMLPTNGSPRSLFRSWRTL